MSAREWTPTREEHQDRVVAEAIEEAEVVMVATEAEEEVVVVAEEDKEVVLARTTTTGMVKATTEETKTVVINVIIREAHQEIEMTETTIVQIDKEEIETTEVHQEEEATTTKDPEEMTAIGRASLPEVAKEREATDKPTTMVRDPEEEALVTEVDKEEEAVQEEEEMIEEREVVMTTEEEETTEVQESLENQDKKSTQRKPEMNFQKSELYRGQRHVDDHLLLKSTFALSSNR